MVFGKILQGFSKTKEQIFNNFKKVFQSATAANIEIITKQQDEIIGQIHEALLRSDVGYKTAEHLTSKMRLNLSSYIEKYKQSHDKENIEPLDLKQSLKEEMLNMLKQAKKKNIHKLDLELKAKNDPAVLFIVGVNGVGKTTTIAKLCHKYKQEPYNRNILVVAGDVTRAAAVRQLEEWCNSVQIPVFKPSTPEPISQKKSLATMQNTLSMALQHQRAMSLRRENQEGSNIHVPDLIIVDTAGRLHNNKDLMSELQMFYFSASKLKKGAPDHCWLVLDASTGQQSIEQARNFLKSVRCNGVIVTKLDGTARGGVLLSITQELGLSVAYVGVGESLDDLRPFDEEQFINSILDHDDLEGEAPTTKFMTSSPEDKV